MRWTTDAAWHARLDNGRMDENRGVFTYLEPATGDCPDCGAAYKWVEVRTEVIDGVTVKTRTFVCGLNHLTTDPAPRTPA